MRTLVTLLPFYLALNNMPSLTWMGLGIMQIG